MCCMSFQSQLILIINVFFDVFVNLCISFSIVMQFRAALSFLGSVCFVLGFFFVVVVVGGFFCWHVHFCKLEPNKILKGTYM